MVSFHTHHGPSFQRLYADTPSRRLVEACDWYSNLDAAYPDPPAWADVVLDYRVTSQSHAGTRLESCRASGGSCDDGRNSPLPAVLGAPALVWKSQMPGWSLEGFTVRGVHRHTQVLRFTDPTGFRGAFVLSGKEGTDADHVKGRFEEWGFETGRFAHLFPTADVYLLSPIQPQPGSMRSRHAATTYAPLSDLSAVGVWERVKALVTPGPDADRPEVPQSRLYRLPALRDALRNPAAWFDLPAGSPATAWRDLTCGPSPTRLRLDPDSEGTATQFPDAMGPDCPVSPDRVLVAYAMGGHTSYAPVARFVAAGLDAAELGRWREADIGKGRPAAHRIADDEIVDWFAVVGGGGKQRRHATAFSGAGVSPAKAQQWQVLGDTPSAYADRIAGFEAAGWSAEDVRLMATTLADVPLDGYLRSSSFKAVEAWTFAPVQAALDFHACGYSATAARTLCEDTEDAEAVASVYASVAAMATLRRPLVTASRY